MNYELFPFTMFSLYETKLIEESTLAEVQTEVNKFLKVLFLDPVTVYTVLSVNVQQKLAGNYFATIVYLSNYRDKTPSF